MKIREITIPSDASESRCHLCGKPVFLVRTKMRPPMHIVEADFGGKLHEYTCRKRPVKK